MHPYAIVCKPSVCIATYIKASANANANTQVHIGLY